MDLEKALHRLPKVDPSKKFCRQAKGRLMYRIQIHENESVWLKFFGSSKVAQPRAIWVRQAKGRLMHRIQSEAAPAVWGWLRRATASALAMVMAVTAVLFSTGTKQPVNAADDSYLQVAYGKVEVKPADQLEWKVVDQKRELSAGDLVRVSSDGLATVHFFDDTQVRLSNNALLLISRIETSPGYGQQGIIETALHRGKAWVQTLNVDDDYARFAMITREAIVSAINGSFDVNTDWFEPTEVRAFKRSLQIEALATLNREVLAKGLINAGEKIQLLSVEEGSYDALADLSTIDSIQASERQSEWVTSNLKADEDHLALLKDREWMRMQAATGSLPGEFLYPVKRAKERLDLALSFTNSRFLDKKIEMANQRLAESIVLIQQGDQSTAKSILSDYESIVKEINHLEESGYHAKKDFSTRVVASKQKVLLSALPSEVQVGLVKQALDKTEEFLADNPVEKVEVRLQNALENLTHVQEFVSSGDLESAKSTLVNQEVMAIDVIKLAELVTDEEMKKSLYSKVLEVQYTQKKLLDEIQKNITPEEDETFDRLIENANQKLVASIETAVSMAQPILPDVVVSDVAALSIDSKVVAFVDKVNIYKTIRGQSNQIARLLKQNPQQARDRDFLRAVQDELTGYPREVLGRHLKELEDRLKASKSKRVKLRIDRAKRLRNE